MFITSTFNFLAAVRNLKTSANGINSDLEKYDKMGLPGENEIQSRP